LNTINRYFRAFVTALRFTMRGEQPPGLRYPEFYAWIKQMAVLVEALYAAADANGLDKNARAATIKLDGRVMTLETAFGTLRYHAAQEYPSLLAHSTNRPVNLGAIQASNMNDLYWLIKLREESALQNAAIQAALDKLSAHLDVIPSITDTVPPK
jgi:hypothetical protein